MKYSLKSKVFYTLTTVLFAIFFSCKNEIPENVIIAENIIKSEVIKPSEKLTEAFKSYWYGGEAEITSYKLEQARYGEIREGNAVLVFVTEDFLPKEQVKADNYSKENTPVLKLNATKKFNTGIYPYSIMQSTFYPVSNNRHALKISASVQEWCGHVYSQLNNRDTFEIKSHSYFQSEADQDFKLEKNSTENQLWTQLRINPESLPLGNITIIPSLEYIRLSHIQLKAYKAIASIETGNYTIYYPELNRTLKINFNTSFPYDILGWEETSKQGYGASAKTLTSKATKLKTLKSAYWGKNSNADKDLRETLRLK